MSSENIVALVENILSGDYKNYYERQYGDI